jgi:hypothetical protein
MPGGRPVKEFHEYLTESKGTLPKVSISEYIDSPATAFLRYCVQAHYAIHYCANHFPGTDTAVGRLEHVSSGLLPAIMGHFETYQRYLFSGVFEHSDLLRGFDVEEYFKKLDKKFSVKIDPVRLAAYRGFNATSGIILADNLPGWHSPQRVNEYFDALLGAEPFDAASVRRIEVLWQLRHSIVHTGGSITLPDAQKIDELRPFAGEVIVFERTFISEVSRKFHAIVFNATETVRKAFEQRMVSSPGDEADGRLGKLFLVKSQVSAWIPR